MANIGDFRLGDTFDFHFTTRQISGAPSTLSSSPVLSCYVGNSTTEITAGITLDVDFDSRTGLNHVRIVATSGNGYATASNYSVVITTGTVNSVTVVGEVVANFSIEARSALMPTTAARTLVVDGAGIADANMVKMGPTGSGTAQTARDIGASVLLSSGTGTGQISLSSGLVSLSGTQTFNVTGNITGNLSGSVGSVTGSVGSVTSGVTVTTNSDKSGYLLAATGSAALTEGYATDGAAFTLNQGLYMIWSLLAERAISSTTLTASKLDGTTPAMTFTLDSATTPNSQTRAT